MRSSCIEISCDVAQSKMIHGPGDTDISNGGVSWFALVCPDLSLLSFVGTFLFWGDFPDLLGFSRFLLFLFLGLLNAPRNIPDRVHNTIRTFPEKSGNPLALQTPWCPFFQLISNPVKQAQSEVCSTILGICCRRSIVRGKRSHTVQNSEEFRARKRKSKEKVTLGVDPKVTRN